MGPPLLRLLLIRAGLVAVPFVLWFAWRWWARRTGREMGATPWPWLLAAGAVLVGLSLIVTALFHRDNRGQTYVPGEATASGEVTAGRFEDRPAPK
jgi:TRAP-type C4-dicarboxylate transport system permease small subunit